MSADALVVLVDDAGTPIGAASKTALRASVAATPFAFSPWLVLQLEQLPG